ncbi:hypothetical protein KCU95_g14855, partial [Aureobasidium melanogenum]
MNISINGQRVNVPQLMAAAKKDNKKSITISTEDYTAKSTTEQSKKYYCSYGKHGYNNSHNTAQCRLRKKIADNPTHPANPIQKMFRQEVARLAKKEVDAVKAEEARKRKEKGKAVSLAGYSNGELKEEFEELKEKLEAFKKEMERRGIR